MAAVELRNVFFKRELVGNGTGFVCSEDEIGTEKAKRVMKRGNEMRVTSDEPRSQKA